MNIFVPAWPWQQKKDIKLIPSRKTCEKWVGISSGHLWLMRTDLWHCRKSGGTSRLDLMTAKTDWRPAWKCKNGPVTHFTSTSDQVLEADIHFLPQLLGHSQDLKQQQYLPRVLHGFGVSFSQQILEPSLVYIRGPLFQGSNRTNNVNVKLQGCNSSHTWSFITFTCWSSGGLRIKSWTCFLFIHSHSTKPGNTVGLKCFLHNYSLTYNKN